MNNNEQGQLDSYAEHMFTPHVRAEQDRVNRGEVFEKIYATRLRGPIDGDTRDFIETRDSFYMATVSESGWPYVQHRGGPAGFLKMTGSRQIGFADYVGNKQFISKGNLKTSDRVSLILMDYPRQARLKMIGHATVVEAGDDEALCEKLRQAEGPLPERLVTIDLVAIDWNCPKYITQRYTRREIDEVLALEIGRRDSRIAELESRLDQVSPGWREV